MKKLIPLNCTSLIPDGAVQTYSGVIFDVYQWKSGLYDGSSATFEMLRRSDTVNVVAIVGEEIVVLNDEQPHRDMVLALPGGRVDKTDASTLEAAQRELHEETGYSLSEWRLVQVTKPVEKMEWFIYTYIAYGEHTKQPPHIDPGERIEVTHRSLDEVKQLRLQGESRFANLDFLENIDSLEQLKSVPEFEGTEIER